MNRPVFLSPSGHRAKSDDKSQARNPTQIRVPNAGNSNLDLNKTADLVIVPAMSPHVIVVSATAPMGWAADPFHTFLDNKASYSNYGTKAIDFAAPGGDAIYPG